MQFIKPGINIDFIGRRKIAFILSLAMILITIASLLFHGAPDSESTLPVAPLSR